MADNGQYEQETTIEQEDSELEITMQPEATTIYGGSIVNSINGQVGDVILTTSDLENTSDYQTGAQVQNAIAGKQDKLTAGTNIQINNNVISATDTTYSAASGLNLSGTTFSVDTNTIATVQDVTNEATTRENADIGLQGQIDAITSSSDVKDIVGTYTELQNYDTSTLGNDDIIKVLQDSTHNNAMTYYRWIISGGSGSWQYIGEEGPYYTKSETETLLNNKQDEITSSNKLLSDLVNDSNQTNKFVTENEKTTWNTEIENLQEENARLKATLPTTTGEGQNITLDKTAEMEFKKPPLPMGNSEQDSTTGKNLFDKETMIQNGYITVNGVISTLNTTKTCVIPCEANKTYTISKISTNKFRVGYLVDNYGNGVNVYGLIQKTIETNITITTGENAKYLVAFVYDSSMDTSITLQALLDSIQCELGSTATSYEPYTGGIPSPNPDYPQEVEVVTGNVEVTISNENNTESKTLPVSLGNIELCKIGNYQDYLYKNNGKWYKYNAINKVVFNGSESWNYNVQNNVAYLQLSTKVSSRKGLFSNLFSYYNADWTAAPDNTISEATSSNFIFIKSTVASDNTAWKSWLSTHNTIVYYVLATPIDTEITDVTLISQLEEISKTLSYQGQTNITSNTIALFDVEAYQDTKMVLDEKYTKPNTGIPKTDLASAVQTTLTKADNQVWYGTQAQYDALSQINPDTLYCIVES